MLQNSYSGRDLTSTVLGVLFIGALTVSSVWVIRPFVSALLWATMIVISTWTVLVAVQNKTGGRRGTATAVMTLVLLLVLVIPLGLAMAVLISNLDDIVEKANSLQTFQVPPPPPWVAQIPLKGRDLSTQWQSLSDAGPGSLSAQLTPYAGTALRWLAAQVGGVG